MYQYYLLYNNEMVSVCFYHAQYGTGPIEMILCMKQADMPRSNIALRLFRSFSQIHHSGRFYDVVTTKS